MSETITWTAPAPAAAIKALTETVRGHVTTASDPGYDSARAVYNAMHDCRPHAVVECMDRADVTAGIAAAGAGAPDLAVRGGGHSVVRAAYDPDNLFRVNLNITPANGS